MVWCFVVGLYLVFAAAGVLTRDFGYYFDDKLHVEALRVTFESGVPLPRYYHYPSVSYIVSMLASLPSLAAHGFDGVAYAGELSAALEREMVPAPRVLLDARALFSALSHLAMFWAALLAWRLSASRLAAISAALILALSFEFHYHSRIWSPDALMAQFVLLSVLCAQRYSVNARPRDLISAAAAAGLAAGTKFPGAMALTAVGVAVLGLEFGAPGKELGLRALGRVARICLLSFAMMLTVFLATTPGILLDYDLAHEHIAMELRHYRGEGSAGAHAPYAVAAGWDNLQRQLAYLTVQALSYSKISAGLLFTLALLGAGWLVRRDRFQAAVLFSLPLLYVAYFSYQRMMVVRNFAVMLPFLAIAAGIGVHGLHAVIRTRALRISALFVVAAALCWNAVFLVRADLSILKRRSLDMPTALAEFVASTSKPLFLAPNARDLIAGRAPGLMSEGKIVVDPREAEHALVLPSDLAQLMKRPGFSKLDLRANWPGIYEPLPEGPWEVNYSYYPTWRGDVRPLRITTEYYRVLAGEQ